MSYWPWWVSGIALASVMLFHYLATGKLMAVSGRFTAIIDRLRFGPTEPAAEMSAEELMAAIQAATMAEFGDSESAAGADESAAGEDNSARLPTEEAPLPPTEPAVALDAGPLLSAPRPPIQHVIFFLTLIVGGTVATALFGSFEVSTSLRSVGFESITQGNPLISSLLLLGGGMLVGFGTRMSGGCTSGHGLCGTSRFQSGSYAATAAFFGAGIITSFILGAL